MNPKRSGYDREHRGLIRKFRLGLGLFVLLLLAFQFVLGVAVVRDEGMGAVCRPGRPVFYLRTDRSAERGGLVCLRLPGGQTAVRRVVAVEGDKVELRGGYAIINGLNERGNYGFTRTEARPEGPAYPIILRRGEVFVLGDAREIAEDSRSFGVVRIKDLLGRPLL